MEWKPSKGLDARWRRPCPIHQSSSPLTRSCSVQLSLNAFQCFGCRQRCNQLDLFAAAMQLPLCAAAIELCQRLGIEARPNRPSGLST